MSKYNIYLIIVLVCAFILLTICVNIKSHRSLKRLIKDRSQFDKTEFLSRLKTSSPVWIIDFILDKLRTMLPNDFPFHPDDKLVSEYCIDEEDVEDIIQFFLDAHVENMDAKQKISMPSDPSVRELILICDRLFVDNS